MADDEIAELLGGGEGEAPKRKRRLVQPRKRASEETAPETVSNDEGNSDESAEAEASARTLDELDVAELLPQQTVKPAENVKSLGDMIAKYGIGSNPEFKLQVWRTYPKIFPGGIKADGFYDTWDQPLTEELVQSEYGGGNFRIVVMGPHPTKPNTLKHYDSYSLNLGGAPKYDRQPRAIQQTQQREAGDVPPPPMMLAQQENAKLSETAMKLAVDMAEKERDERRRVEDRSEAKAKEALAANLPLLDAERRRADDLIKAERERGDLERKMLVERLEDARAETRKLVERIEQMEMNRPSVASELAQLLPHVAGKPNEEAGKAAERMMENVLEKHRIEMEAIRAQHNQMVESINKQHETAIASMRQSHQQEIAFMREANARELQAERESGIRRMERMEDQLKAERDERRRDQERHKELLDANDRTWKDRIESQLASNNTSWEARHQTVVGSHETKALYLQQEIDRLKAEISDLRMKAVDNSDPIAIVTKAKEIREAIGGPEASGGSSGGSSGGIGLGSGDDWKNLAVEGLTERAPQILQALGGLLSGQQGQQGGGAPQQQFTPGQVVQTPQGEMVVIQMPNGQLGMTPKAALDAAQSRSQSRMLPPEKTPQRRHVMPDVEEIDGSRRGRKRPVSAVPNFADAGAYGDKLNTKRRPPWEGGGADGDEDASSAQQQAAPPIVTPPPRRTSAPAQERPAPQQRITRQMTGQERQGLSILTKLVHEAVMGAEEPDDFAEKVLKEWSPDLLKRVVSAYSPDDIARGINEMAPHSAGATPAGQAFIRDAFAKIEGSLS